MKRKTHSLYRKIGFTSAYLGALALPSSGSTISVTGYNTDVVYEAGATGSGNGSFLNENQALYEAGLGGRVGSGLPVNRTLTSDFDGTVFAFADYTTSNALIVREDGGGPKFAAWTLTVGSQAEYSKVSVIGLSSGGQSSFSLVFFFTDGTNTSSGDPNFENSGHYARGAFDGQTLPDWFQDGGTAAGRALAGVGRVDSTNGTSFSGDDAGGGVRLQQFNFDLSGYSGKTLEKVEFESTGGGGNNRTFLAISGIAIPEPGSAILLLGSVGTLLLKRRRRATNLGSLCPGPVGPVAPPQQRQ